MAVSYVGYRWQKDIGTYDPVFTTLTFTPLYCSGLSYQGGDLVIVQVAHSKDTSDRLASYPAGLTDKLLWQAIYGGLMYKVFVASAQDLGPPPWDFVFNVAMKQQIVLIDFYRDCAIQMPTNYNTHYQGGSNNNSVDCITMDYSGSMVAFVGGHRYGSRITSFDAARSTEFTKSASVYTRATTFGTGLASAWALGPDAGIATGTDYERWYWSGTNTVAGMLIELPSTDAVAPPAGGGGGGASGTRYTAMTPEELNAVKGMRSRYLDYSRPQRSNEFLPVDQSYNRQKGYTNPTPIIGSQYK